MGANIHCNGYFPGYYSTTATARNLNFDANGSSWPLNFDDKVLESGNYCNGFLSTDCLFAYNKELLKQTMLKHETMFRDQIQELHRLYRRQRELTDEIRRNELDKNYLRFEASHSNTGLFRMPSEYVQNTFQVPRFPLISPAGSRMSVSDSEKIQSPLSSVQGKNIQVCPPYPAKSEACSKDLQSLESKCKKVGKKLLDLQLSADEYIDCEDKDLLDKEKVSEVPEISSYSVKKSPKVVYTSDVNSFFGSKLLNSVFHGSAETTASILEKQKWSADVDEPGKPEEAAASFSNGFRGPTSHSKLICCEVAGKEQSGFQSSLDETIQNTQKRPEIDAPVNFIRSGTERKQEQLSYHDNAGKLRSNLNPFFQGFNAEKLSSFSKSLHKEIEQVYEPPTFHQQNQSSCIESTIYDLERSKRNAARSNDSNFGQLDSFYGSTFNDHSPQTNTTNSESSSVLSLRKICDTGQNPIPVQALPCFNTSMPLGKRFKSSVGRPELAGDSKLVLDNHSLTEHKGSMVIQSSNDINLNSKPPSCSSEFAVSQSIRTTHGTEKQEYSVGGRAWLRAKPVHNGENNNGHGNSTQVESFSLEAYSSGLHDVEPKKVGASDSLSKMIPGSHDYNKSYISGNHYSSSSNLSKVCQNPFKDVRSRGKEMVIDLNMACDSVPESEVELTADEHVAEDGVVRKHIGFGCLIDLNSSINEAEFSQKPLLTAEIDLDAPASPENKECSPPRGESDENQVETPLLLSGQEDADQPDELTRVAAEAIVSISSSRSTSSLTKTTCKHLEASSSDDSLHWFAGIVSLVASDPENESGLVLNLKSYGNCEEHRPDGMDYFEAMTLQLTETKMEECCCKSNGSKEEETGTSSSPAQSRKGRTRQGRQRKDFQSEILPSLASLSRYEVTEDLQTIGGLMEAAGTHWETGSMRYAARNGYSRARKRSSISGTNPAVGCSVESLLKQLNSNNKPGKEERSIICWGKVTRRRRGQRYPVRVSNPQLILSQV